MSIVERLAAKISRHKHGPEVVWLEDRIIAALAVRAIAEELEDMATMRENDEQPDPYAMAARWLREQADKGEG